MVGRIEPPSGVHQEAETEDTRWPGVNSLSVSQRFLILASIASAYGSHFFPEMKIRAWVRELAGNPPFAGSWVLVEHWLLVATVPALASLILWSLLARGRMLVKPSDSLRLSYARKATWTIGLGAGLAFALFVLLFVFVCSQAGLGVGFRVACPSFWEVAGNMVSNFLEEIIYRGFLLIGLWVVSGRCWVGIVASSLVFGLTHTQNDFIVQTVIALGGAVMAWAYVRTRSLWSAWTVHMIFDLAADIFLGAGA